MKPEQAEALRREVADTLADILTIRVGPEEWFTYAETPPLAKALIDVALSHREREVDCGDHSRTTCTCGEPDESRERIPEEVFADPEARREWRDETVRIRHRFSWERHFAEEWNKALKEATK